MKMRIRAAFECSGLTPLTRWNRVNGAPLRLGRTALEVEAVAEFGVDLAGIVVVEAAEGEAVVEQDAAVGDVGGGEEAVRFSPKVLPRARSKVVCWGR